MPVELRGPKRAARFDGPRLKAFRESIELTQEQMAGKGLSVASIRRAEKGHRVSWDTVATICSSLNVEPETLLARPFVGVPPRLASFIGRTDELDEIDRMLLCETGLVGHSSPADLGRAAVTGMGGIGKTSLAIEYVFRKRDSYAGVWWCAADTRIALLGELASLAQHLGVTSAGGELERLAKTGLRRLAQQSTNYLLVYDNVLSPDEIEDLLPASGARVLIISRFSDWSNWANTLELRLFPESDSIAFLMARAGREDEKGARGLAQALGMLPLALDHAAAYCKQAQVSFDDYRQRATDLADVTPRGAAYPRSVTVTFTLAIAEVAARYPPSEAMMAFLAHCAPERIPALLAEGAVDGRKVTERALLALADFSLARADPFENGTAAWTVHRLVQEAARGLASSIAAAERVLSRLLAIYPPDGFDDPTSWLACEQLTPHLAEFCTNHLERDPGNLGVAELAARAGGYLHARAAYREALLYKRRALAIREMTLGPRHPHTAESLNNLALLLYDQGDYVSARPLHERALAIRQETLPPNDGLIAESLNNLALVLHDLGDLGASRSLHERALVIYKDAFGAKHALVAKSLNNLGVLSHDEGDLTQAQSFHEQALAIREEELGPKHPLTAQSFTNLALVLKDRCDFDTARLLCERALAIKEEALGPDHPETAASLSALSDVLVLQGDMVSARLLRERTLSILTEAFGTDHPTTNRVRCSYGRLLLAQGQPELALDNGERALVVHERILGAEHGWTMDSAKLVVDALDQLSRGEEGDNVRARFGIHRSG